MLVLQQLLIVRSGNKNLIPLKIKLIPAQLHALFVGLNEPSTFGSIVNHGIRFNTNGIPISYFFSKEGELKRDLLHLWRDGLGADHILKTESHFLLCETIKEPEWEEIYEQEESIPELSA